MGLHRYRRAQGQETGTTSSLHVSTLVPVFVLIAEVIGNLSMRTLTRGVRSWEQMHCLLALEKVAVAISSCLRDRRWCWVWRPSVIRHRDR